MEKRELSPEKLALLHALNEKGKKLWREAEKKARKNKKATELVEVCYGGKYMMFPRHIVERK